MAKQQPVTTTCTRNNGTDTAIDASRGSSNIELHGMSVAVTTPVARNVARVVKNNAV